MFFSANSRLASQISSLRDSRSFDVGVSFCDDCWNVFFCNSCVLLDRLVNQTTAKAITPTDIRNPIVPILKSSKTYQAPLRAQATI